MCSNLLLCELVNDEDLTIAVPVQVYQLQARSEAAEERSASFENLAAELKAELAAERTTLENTTTELTETQDTLAKVTAELATARHESYSAANTAADALADAEMRAQVFYPPFANFPWHCTAGCRVGDNAHLSISQPSSVAVDKIRHTTVRQIVDHSQSILHTLWHKLACLVSRASSTDRNRTRTVDYPRTLKHVLQTYCRQRT